VGIKRKQHSAEFKARVAMTALSGEKTLAELSVEFGVHPTMISNWKQELVKRAGETLRALRRPGDTPHPRHARPRTAHGSRAHASERASSPAAAPDADRRSQCSSAVPGAPTWPCVRNPPAGSRCSPAWPGSRPAVPPPAKRGAADCPPAGVLGECWLGNGASRAILCVRPVTKSISAGPGTDQW
jgi:transposase-like protein